MQKERFSGFVAKGLTRGLQERLFMAEMYQLSDLELSSPLIQLNFSGVHMVEPCRHCLKRLQLWSWRSQGRRVSSSSSSSVHWCLQ